MKKNVIYIAIITLVFIFVIAAVLSVKYMTEISKELSETNIEKKADNIPDYHFMIITNELNFSSGQAFIDGVNLACEDYNAVVEINEFKRENIDQQIKTVAIAVASKVDGIILQATDQDLFVEQINQAVDQGIPVITIFEDAARSKRLSYIGVNSYELGTLAADLASKAVAGSGEMAIIFDGLEDKQFDTAKSLIEAGVREGLVKSPDLTLKMIDITTTGILGAGDITKEIITQEHGVNVIFCTSPNTTKGVAQAIVDLNMVGKIKIIGYGDDQYILNYIEKGIIDVSLLGDNQRIGYQSIESAMKYLEEGRISDFEDAGIYVINKDNVGDYLDKAGEEGEGNWDKLSRIFLI